MSRTIELKLRAIFPDDWSTDEAMRHLLEDEQNLNRDALVRYHFLDTKDLGITGNRGEEVGPPVKSRKPLSACTFTEVSGMLCEEYRNGGYRSHKDRFLRLAKAYLERLAETLELQKGSYEVRVNKGGIAVSGEATLHAERIYVVFSADYAPHGLLYRSCAGRKDYTGGMNQWITYDDLFKDPAGSARKIYQAIGKGT